MGSPGNARAISDGKFLNRKAMVDAFGQFHTRPTDIDHDNIHRGTAFQLARYGNVSESGNLDLIIVVGTKEAHMRAFAACGNIAAYRLYEAPTLTGGSSAITPRNRNRMASDIPSFTAAVRTVTDTGTPLDERFVPAASAGGKFAAAEEWVLKPGETYLLRVTNIGTGTAPGSIEALIYERAVS
jgi:hypothetical protein